MDPTVSNTKQTHACDRGCGQTCCTLLPACRPSAHPPHTCYSISLTAPAATTCLRLACRDWPQLLHWHPIPFVVLRNTSILFCYAASVLLGTLLLALATGLSDWTHTYDATHHELYAAGPWRACCFGSTGARCGPCTSQAQRSARFARKLATPVCLHA